jgi:hypothetical protein
MSSKIERAAYNLATERCGAIDHLEKMRLAKELKEAELAILKAADVRLKPIEPFVKNVRCIDNGRQVVDRVATDMELATSALERLTGYYADAQDNLQRDIDRETGFYESNQETYKEIALRSARHDGVDIYVNGEVINTYELLSDFTYGAEPTPELSPSEQRMNRMLREMSGPACMDRPGSSFPYFK